MTLVSIFVTAGKHPRTHRPDGFGTRAPWGDRYPQSTGGEIDHLIQLVSRLGIDEHKDVAKSKLVHTSINPKCAAS